MPTFFLSSPGDRPAYHALAEHLWGIGCDIDSDGNSSSPDATDWTELTIILRANTDKRIDIDSVSSTGPLVLSIRSDDAELAYRAALYLCDVAGGELTKP
ncbi:hypothetical protein ADU59_28995 [Pararhizobium polonicum]|uniref:Uncharacterized protein n=2 Tax=Pararhizobium polonicum TaxID=1612624 RepID=A0A1C7NTJ2_9HYPH|nr:hypothetical protein ADU59_28995 [Pararhizobium polonicum]